MSNRGPFVAASRGGRAFGDPVLDLDLDLDLEIQREGGRGACGDRRLVSRGSTRHSDSLTSNSGDVAFWKGFIGHTPWRPSGRGQKPRPTSSIMFPGGL